MMGLGDSIMATAWAKLLYEKVGERVQFGYWDEIFEHNPYMHRYAQLVVPNHRPGNRPYILGKYKDGFIFNPSHRPVPGNIHLTDEERKRAETHGEGFILIEPHVKGTVSGQNKDWGWNKWGALVRHEEDWLQCRYAGKRVLNNVNAVPTNTFREACALLERASLFVGSDGGLHHAAAALGVPAVVVWGGYSSPEILGYANHHNIWDGDDPCGSLVGCAHCVQKMSETKVRTVWKEIVSARVPEEEDTGRNQAQSCG
jgi:ADP-heptose:LPS heptosyltransferase